MADNPLNANTTQCQLVCDDEADVVQLTFLTNSRGAWMQPIADAYEEKMQGAVKIEIVQVEPADLFPNIINEAISQIGLYDGFITSPIVTGSVVQYDGFADLTPFIQETAERAASWADVLLGYRKWVAQYQEKIIMFPLDGDMFSLFYRRDVLEEFKLPVPRTWDEYAATAEAVHGKVFQGNVLQGSCIGRTPNCAGVYWANLVIASMTQTEGAWQGHLFDTADMLPLTGPVLEETLRLMELQAKYGSPDEFDQCIATNLNNMKMGDCVLTYNWGNSFKQYLEEGTQLRTKFGVAPTPGSTKVLDRQTMKLVPCTEEKCSVGGAYYDDIGWVNKAPYMAFGGWACAVNNYTNPRSKRLAIEFCAFASSKEQSINNIIPNATGNDIGQGQDPFRRSHLDLDLYEANGYERETAKQFIDSILEGLESNNVVTDIRFPTSTDIYSVLDAEFFSYLNETTKGSVPESERPERRQQVSESITSQWNDIITKYDSHGTTRVPVLEAYQRLRNVYEPQVDMNQLGKIRAYGNMLVSLVFLSSLVFGLWTVKYRKSHIVRASQPFFLVMLCTGTIILGSTIIPLGIDDYTHSVSACSKACMSIPWLLALGWSIVFSALFSKLWRVNIVYKHSMHFRRLKVSEKDVLLPFVMMFSLNLVVLVLWTTLDPLFWKRIEINDMSSYGTCTADQTSVTWKVMLGLLTIVNGAALILANVEAYKARHITTEYGESKHIGMIMGSILQVILVGIPLLFLVNDNPTASYFIRSSIVFVICISILVLIFVPKIQTWLKKKDARKMSNMMETKGLRFQVYDNPSVVAERAAKLDDYRTKIAALEEMMIERGYAAEELLREVGLNASVMDLPATHSTYPASSAVFSSQSQERAPSSMDVDQATTFIDSKTAEETIFSEEQAREEGSDEVASRHTTLADSQTNASHLDTDQPGTPASTTPPDSSEQDGPVRIPEIQREVETAPGQPYEKKDSVASEQPDKPKAR